MPVLHFGDCYNLMRRLAPNSVDLLLTDPPYGVSRPSNRHTMGRQGPDLGEWDVVDHTWFELARPLLVSGANVVVFHDVWLLGDVRAQLEAVGATVRRVLTWTKTNPNPGNRERSFTQTIETAVWATVGDGWTFNRRPDVGYETGVFSCAVPRDKIDVRHPCQKPLRVLRAIIEVLSNPGDRVLDPFGGVGSTALAAHALDRDWVLCERRADYFLEAQARLARAGVLPDPALEEFV